GAQSNTTGRMVVGKRICRNIVTNLADVEKGCHLGGALGIEKPRAENLRARLGAEAYDAVVGKARRPPASLGAAIDEKVAALPAQARQRPEGWLAAGRHLLDECMGRQHYPLAKREVVTQFGAKTDIGKRTAEPPLGHPDKQAIQPALSREIDVVAAVISGNQFVEELAAAIEALQVRKLRARVGERIERTPRDPHVPCAGIQPDLKLLCDINAEDRLQVSLLESVVGLRRARGVVADAIEALGRIVFPKR